MRISNVKITSRPEDLTEGLFGQVILYVFEILPHFHSRTIFPDWEIRATRYGMAPTGLIIPGVLDLAYRVSPGFRKELNLLHFRARHRCALGSDWSGLSKMWNSYFCIPDRIMKNAAALGSLSDVLGIHYRGNDKLTSSWDTNSVSQEDYLMIIRDFIRRRPEFKRIFLATDDFSFHGYLQSKVSLEIINLGPVDFHKAHASADVMNDKADRAMLDCVLLSRCGVVLQTSSALSGFAKVFNPGLEIYRVAASKLFMNVPYFPVAYIPRYETNSPDVAAIVERLMDQDWTLSPVASRYLAPFVWRQHWPPIIRTLFSYTRRAERLPGFYWISRVPNWVATCGRKMRELVGSSSWLA